MKTRHIMWATLVLALLITLPRHLTYVHDPACQGVWFNAGPVEVALSRNIKWWQEEQNYLDYHLSVIVGENATRPPS